MKEEIRKILDESYFQRVNQIGYTSEQLIDSFAWNVKNRAECKDISFNEWMKGFEGDLLKNEIKEICGALLEAAKNLSADFNDGDFDIFQAAADELYSLMLTIKSRLGMSCEIAKEYVVEVMREEQEEEKTKRESDLWSPFNERTGETK